MDVCFWLLSVCLSSLKCFLYATETGESVLLLKGPQGRINRAVWGPLNKTIISGGEDAVVRIWDSEVMIVFMDAYQMVY